MHIIIGQEAITPKGLGRVMAFQGEYPKYRWISVRLYSEEMEIKFHPQVVELIDPRNRCSTDRL